METLANENVNRKLTTGPGCERGARLLFAIAALHAPAFQVGLPAGPTGPAGATANQVTRKSALLNARPLLRLANCTANPAPLPSAS
jgi:hypothetical protein